MKIDNEMFNDLHDEFLALINDDPDFNYNVDEFGEWLKDYYPDVYPHY